LTIIGLIERKTGLRPFGFSWFLTIRAGRACMAAGKQHECRETADSCADPEFHDRNHLVVMKAAQQVLTSRLDGIVRASVYRRKTA
jgi:hypothetical protein